MKKVRIYTVDAFTDKPFLGNPAAVVIADDLTEQEMQKIANEVNLSETAFIIKSTKEEINFKVRYFTPHVEIDFCGHATIALAWVILSNNLISKNQPLRIETNIGIIPIEYKYNGNKLDIVTMKQVEPIIDSTNLNINLLCSMLGIIYYDLDNRFPIKIAYTGNYHLLIPIKTRKAIDQARPDFIKLANFNKNINVSTTHLFTFDTEEDYLVYTRDFAPVVGVNEDPVTGSANGALAAYLYKEKIVKLEEYKILQGNSLNRYGELFINVKEVDKKVSIHVGGRGVILINGYLNL